MPHRETFVSSVLIALLLQIPFAILFFIPHSEFGAPGPGVVFFLPSLALASLFHLGRWAVVITVIVCQVTLVSVPVFWVLTRRTRSTIATAMLVSSYLATLTIGSMLLVQFERQRTEKLDAMQGAGRTPIVNSIERLNKSLVFFKGRYGTFPETLEQLDFAPDGSIDSRHAGLVEFPLPVEEFFTFTYTARQSGDGRYLMYELYADAKPGRWSNLYHYHSDETGSIRFDTTHDACKYGAIIK